MWTLIRCKGVANVDFFMTMNHFGRSQMLIYRCCKPTVCLAHKDNIRLTKHAGLNRFTPDLKRTSLHKPVDLNRRVNASISYIGVKGHEISFEMPRLTGNALQETWGGISEAQCWCGLMCAKSVLLLLLVLRPLASRKNHSRVGYHS